jgi:peptidylprolyl isomerase
MPAAPASAPAPAVKPAAAAAKSTPAPVKPAIPLHLTGKVTRDHNDVRLATSSGSYDVLLDAAGKRFSVALTGKQAVVTAELTGHLVPDHPEAAASPKPGAAPTTGSVKEVRILSFGPASGAPTARFAVSALSSGPNALVPPGLPAAKGAQKTAFVLRYQDIVIGTGADAEPNKVYKVHYTGWLGANGRDDDGHKFDSSYDHPGPPIRDKDNKPVLGDDGKPKTSDPIPYQFLQGGPPGRGPFPGFEQGFEGMKVGGKRRLFIPWELAYGAKGRPSPDAAHTGIPPFADLIFDVELVDVADAPPPPPARPPMGGRPMPRPGTPGVPPTPGQPGGVTPLPGITINGAPGVAPKVGAPGTPATPAVPGTSMSPGIPGKPATPPPPPGASTPAPPQAQPKPSPAPSTPPAQPTPPPPQ